MGIFTKIHFINLVKLFINRHRVLQKALVTDVTNQRQQGDIRLENIFPPINQIFLFLRTNISAMLEENMIIVAEEYVNRLRQGGIPIESAFLFGYNPDEKEQKYSSFAVWLVSEIFDTEDEAVLKRPLSRKFLKDKRLWPLAIGTKRFFTENDHPSFVEFLGVRGFEINLSPQSPITGSLKSPKE